MKPLDKLERLAGDGAIADILRCAALYIEEFTPHHQVLANAQSYYRISRARAVPAEERYKADILYHLLMAAYEIGEQEQRGGER